MSVREISVRSLLTRSAIPGIDYCINPYVGCSHGCRYCYATFMKRFTGHTEDWGKFLDIKINGPEALRRQHRKLQRCTVMLSSVTDPYQPAESRYRLTRQCLETLLGREISVSILTKSPLVLRDTDLLRRFNDIEVGITITTDSEKIRNIFEPNAPPIADRINALKTLHEKGVATYVFIGPVLPMHPEELTAELRTSVDSVLIDRMNYVSKTEGIFRQLNLSKWVDRDYVDTIIQRLKQGFEGMDVSVC